MEVLLCHSAYIQEYTLLYLPTFLLLLDVDGIMFLVYQYSVYHHVDRGYQGPNNPVENKPYIIPLSSYLHSQLFDHSVSEALLNLVYVSILEGAVHGTIGDAVTLRSAPLGMELINQLDGLDPVLVIYVAGNRAHIVIGEFVTSEERYVFVTNLVLGKWFVLGNLSRLELTQEAWLITPEQTNVGNVEKNHSQTLQTQTKSPGLVVGKTQLFHDIWVNRAGSQDF